MQTFCEETFELKVLVDTFGTLVYEEIAHSPAVRIKAGEARGTVVTAPTVVRAGEAFEVRVRREDAWGNPALKVLVRRHKGFARPGVFRVRVRSGQGWTKSNPNVVQEAYVLTDEPTPCEMHLERQIELRAGENPVYTHVVQEDGQRAWSSPIYIKCE